MATQTKTLILRPTRTVAINNSGSNTVNAVPEDTSEENFYILLADDVADDDATKITISSGCSAVFGFAFEGIENVISADIFLRMYTTATVESSCVININYVDTNGSSVLSVDESVDTTDQNGLWTDETISLSSSFSQFNLLSSGEVLITLNTVHPTSGSKVYVPSYTQIYIKITYEEPEVIDKSIYMRENDAWIQLTGTIYQKQNGVWIEYDSIPSSGQKYNLQLISS